MSQSSGKKASKKNQNRPDHTGTHRGAFEKNKRKILATQDICGICGLPVDKKLKYPHPLSPCIDHIIPVARGGHPSDINNLQLAHWSCNRAKSDKIITDIRGGSKNVENKGLMEEVINNRNLPLSMDWKKYRAPSSRPSKSEENLTKDDQQPQKETVTEEKSEKRKQKIMF